MSTATTSSDQVVMGFMAEIQKGKQDYLASRFPGVPIFQDVSEMDKAFARTANGNAARVPEARSPKYKSQTQ